MIKTVLFDLDGTLADTAFGLGLALNRLLVEEGRPPLPDARIRSIASHGARALVTLGFGMTPDHPAFESLRLRYLDHYSDCFTEHACLFDGVTELIRALSERTLPWGIVTNKSMRFTDRLIPLLPFPSAPRVVVSGDTVGVAKPDPRPMLYACEQIGVAPQDTLYVGDAERDIQAGHNAGMLTALATWGYIAENDHPATWGAEFSLQTPLELLRHLC